MENKKLILTVIALVLALGLLNFYAINTMNVEATVDMSQVTIPQTDLSGLVTADQLNAAISGIVISASTTTIVDGEVVAAPSVDYSGEYVLTKDDFEEEATEAEALELATESVESRDFKKAVYDALVAFGVDIESYKDITEIKNVEDADVDGDEVEFDLKVYYFIEGDEDEAYKSRLEDFTVEVDDLDFDDDFEDAEVDEDYLDNLVVKYAREL